MPTYITLPSLSANKVLTASYLNQLNDDLRVISLHDHSGSLGEGNTNVTNSGSGASPYTYRYEVICALAPSQTNWSDNIYDLLCLFDQKLRKTLASNASLIYPVALYAGTYQLQVMFNDSVGSGSTKILLGGASIASIATNFTANNNTVCAITGIQIATSGSTTIEFDTASNTNFEIIAFKILRTGN